ncbi:MAG TPA: PP2C family protein-serine/threonine phosphatase [Thermoanaerobaculia bacterium]
MPSNFRFTRRDAVVYIPLAIVGGALVAIAITGFRISLAAMGIGGIIGLFCFGAAVGAEWLFGPWFDKKPEAWWRRASLYFLASQIAWPIGLVFAIYVFFGSDARIRFPRQMFAVAVVLGGGGTVIGLGVQAYERMKERLSRSIEELKEKEFAEKELHLARELQSRMLPAPEIAADGYRISGRNFAARYVAGDFYDVFRFADGAIGVAVADVAGKGLAASLIMASVKAVLPLLASTRSIDDAMVALNEKLAGELSKREFVALSLVRYEPPTGRLFVANAGLPDPYVVRRDGDVVAVEVPGPRLPLGLRKSVAYEKREISLEKGEALMMFSDGLPEATIAGGEQIGYDGLLRIVRDSGARIDDILARVHAVEAGPREDDQTVVMIERV